MKTIDYELVDSGYGRKLERFGQYLISRPCAQAVWKPHIAVWENVHASFSREAGWTWTVPAPKEWSIDINGLKMRLQPTDFGHLGIFPEQIPFWNLLKNFPSHLRVLNLFAYSGGSTLACAQNGMQVCHLDASKGMVEWARGNALLNNLQEAPIRWIVEDVFKFLGREIKRASLYDGIILDPPSFGRGSKSEVFKIEDDVNKLLSLCRTSLSSTPAFILFSCHTPGFTPITLHHLLSQMMEDTPGSIEYGEMVLSGKSNLPVPSGSFAIWKHSSLLAHKTQK